MPIPRIIPREITGQTTILAVVKTVVVKTTAVITALIPLQVATLIASSHPKG